MTTVAFIRLITMKDNHCRRCSYVPCDLAIRFFPMSTHPSGLHKGIDQASGPSPNSEQTSRAAVGFQHYMDDWQPSEAEKDLLRRTFSFDFDFLYDLGCNIYLYIFARNPRIRELFPQLKDYNGADEDIHKYKAFRGQALRFSQVISYVVRGIYHMDQVVQHLQDVGVSHVKYLDRGFRSEYWNIFQDAIQDALTKHIQSIPDLTEQQKTEATEAWRTLALFIIVHMKHGFVDEMTRTGKQELP